MKKPEAVTETLWRYRGVLLVLLIPVILIAAVLTILPRTSTLARDPMLTINELQNHKSGLRYAIVFDAGSTGSRVHVFKFNLDNGDLKLESDTFEQLKPGLSSYADDPAKAAASLLPLIETALKTVPKELQAITPVSLKATAGLRLLDGDKAEKILQAVTQTLAALPFKLADDAVGIMDGKDEGAYAWLTLNYLLGKLGGGPTQTVSAIDLGGGSVQEAFALTSEQAQNAPKEFLTKLSGGGKTYHVYVHSYLGYGLMAARAKVIETAKDAADKGHPCYAKGSDSVYQYAGKEYPFKALGQVASYKQCTAVHVEALDIKKECAAPQEECTFSGVWHGKRPSDAPYFLSSYFWDRAMDTGLIKDERAIMWTTSPSEFATTAVEVCGQKGIEAVSKTYPRAKPDGVPFLCTDLTYVVQLMLAGFKLPPTGQLTLVKQIEYNGQNIEAAWPLGAAVNDLSS